MKAIILIALYIAVVCFIARFVAVCKSVDNTEEMWEE